METFEVTATVRLIITAENADEAREAAQATLDEVAWNVDIDEVL